jgi:hypothetical protein
MTGLPAPTLYHRWLGWHAPAMRRAITVLIAGLIVAAAPGLDGGVQGSPVGQQPGRAPDGQPVTWRLSRTSMTP